MFKCNFEHLRIICGKRTRALIKSYIVFQLVTVIEFVLIRYFVLKYNDAFLREIHRNLPLQCGETNMALLIVFS